MGSLFIFSERTRSNVNNLTNVDVFVLLEDDTKLQIASDIDEPTATVFMAGFFCGNRDIGEFSSLNECKVASQPANDTTQCICVSNLDGDYMDFIIVEHKEETNEGE